MFFGKSNDAEILALKEQVRQLTEEKHALNEQLHAQSFVAESIIEPTSQGEELFIARGVFGNMVTFSAFVAEIQQSLLSVSQSLRDEKPNVTRAAEVSSECRESIGHIATALVSMAGDTVSTGQVVEGLSHRAEEIGRVVTLIKNISDQMNLLVLNAATESECDKGCCFSVVTDEVRLLVKQTTDATSEISMLVDAIQLEISQARKQIEAVSISSGNFSQVGSNAKGQMDEMINISSGMEVVINQSALRSFVEVVKVDHLVWKLEVYKVFMGVSDKMPKDFADHTMCRLGQWYYQGEGHQNFSRLSGFSGVEKPHKAVHQSGLVALTKLKTGKNEEALQYLAVMEQESMGVLRALTDLANGL